MTYVGPPKVWQLDIVSEDRGTTAPYSVVNVGYQTYFLSQDGFYVTNGSEFNAIGNDRINAFFFENVDQGQINQVQGSVDWENGAVVWAYREQGAGNDFTRLMIYSWRYDRWSTATVTTDWIVSSTIEGLSIDQLDAIYGDLDSIPVSLDSGLFRAGERRLAAFIQNPLAQSEYNVFNGDPLEATWQTGEFEPSPARRSFINEIYPVIEADQWDIMCAVAARDNQGVVQTSPLLPTGVSGFCPAEVEGQKVGIRMVKNLIPRR